MCINVHVVHVYIQGKILHSLTLPICTCVFLDIMQLRADISHVERQLEVSQNKHEELKKEYTTFTRTLQETEQSLARANTVSFQFMCVHYLKFTLIFLSSSPSLSLFLSLPLPFSLFLSLSPSLSLFLSLPLPLSLPPSLPPSRTRTV